MAIELKDLPQLITAIGGIGTAAFGLVDASKVVAFDGVGINHIGFGTIKKTVKSLTPPAPGNALSQEKVLDTLKANWYNGTDLSSQKAIAKSLIKLNLSPGNAAAVAAQAGVDPAVLTAVAMNIVTGTPLNVVQTDVYARFDFIVTALLDESYQRSDNLYRNWTRALAAVFAVVLAIFGGKVVGLPLTPSLLAGLLATPLAPIAKDLSSALATAVNSMQAVKKA
jgi:hypothetical protein